MKLIIILAVTTCAFAAKLDRTYLPPPGAEAAGGSPGSLNAPRGPSGSQFGGSNQLSGPSSHGSFAPTFGGQSGVQDLNERGNQGQALPFGGRGSHSGTGNQAQASPFGSQGLQSEIGNQGQSTPFGSQGSQSGVGNQAPTGFNNQNGNTLANAPINYDQNPNASNQDSATSPDFRHTYSQPERAQAAADRAAEIIRYDNEIDGDSFAYSFETSNGISAEESGVATNGVQAKGAFSYTGDDGQIYSITYTADENGYQPHGDHLPTPPPIPEEILRSIEENARAAAAGTQEGAYNEEDNDAQYNDQPPGTAQQQYQSQQSSMPSNQYGAPNLPNPAGQSFNRQGSHDGTQPRPSNQYGTPSLKPTSTQENGQFDASNAPSNNFQQYQQSNADQDIYRPQFNQGSSVFNQQAFRPSNQYGSPSIQQTEVHSNGNNFQRPGKPGQSLNLPQSNQGSQAQIQQSSRPFGQPERPTQSYTQSQFAAPSSSQQNNAPANQQSSQGLSSSTKFNPLTGYEYNRPIAKGFDAQPSQSSNFNMLVPSAPVNKYTAPSSQVQGSISQRPQGSIPQRPQGSIPQRPQGSIPQRPQGSAPSAEQFTRPSGFKQPSGVNVAPKNYPGTSQSFNAASKPGQEFPGPRQPPSFTPEEGYKY